MPDAATAASTAASTDVDTDLLVDLCRELAETADAVGEAARYASGLALGARLPAAALARGGRRRLGWRTLLRTLTDPSGLGWAPRGRGVARAGRLAGMLTGRESLAITVAVCGLRVRIRAASAARPDLLGDPGAAAVLKAVEEGRQAEATRLFRGLMRDRGAGPAFSLLTPAFADILAWNALTDANPFNDHAGWQVATGRAVPAEPLLGLGAAVRAFCDRGPGVPAGQSPPSAPDPRPLRALPPPAPQPFAHSYARPCPNPCPDRPGSLRAHAAALRSHAVRLRAAAAAPAWRGRGADVLRSEVRTLAGRCATAADGFNLAAAQLGEVRRPR
ncbi:hypothetical protein [Streptomyces sp. NBC_01408]|uniref:hypothetical protein n=1 Tax=Streptomyces sp. NBC_01408 TaxID=2903855 RepID=UPI00225A45C2|nr:hypothetical protein [Streptomyces sp. NBC_01408]MCX4695209.1 hypothetical protein [Streptomyces sp. NBC_01408]